MKNIQKRPYLLLLILIFILVSCEDFIDIEAPNDQLSSKNVFSNDLTAQSALTGIYNQLFNTSLVNGSNRSATFLAGLSADNLTLTSGDQELLQFSQNNLTAPNSFNFDLWAGAYNLIYLCNSLLEGIENSTTLSRDTVENLEGSAKFIRAFTYFYLLNLYGDVPLLLETDYRQNAIASRTSKAIIYEQVIDDLETAANLLSEIYEDNDRSSLNKFAAISMLARVHLFLENWEQAEIYSNLVINHTPLYELSEPEEVFLANSREAIWQISPIGWGNNFRHTREGNLFIKTAINNTPAVLSDDFVLSWENYQDKRFQNWVAPFSQTNDTLYFPYKYKIQYDATGSSILEYSMVIRLAELYLIRAEARARSGNLEGAITDINEIRSRAETPLITQEATFLNEDAFLKIILSERRKELFTEWGHRWFDLRRYNQTEALEQKDNSDWQPADWLYPIPQDERMKNPNLTQNESY